MSNEIFTSNDMDKIVNILMKSATEGCMTARLVDAVNNSINDLKPGKPLSKAEKEALTNLWDNLIIAFANDAVPTGYLIRDGIRENKMGVALKDRMSPALMEISKAYDDKVKATIAKGAAKGKSDDMAKTDKAIKNIFSLLIKDIEEACNTFGISNVAELLDLPEDVILGALKHDQEAVDKVIDVSPIKLAAVTAMLESMCNHADDECPCDDECPDKKDKCAPDTIGAGEIPAVGLGCRLGDCLKNSLEGLNRDNETPEDSDNEKLLVDVIYNILKEEADKEEADKEALNESIKKTKDADKPEGKYKVYCFSTDTYEDPFVRHSKMVEDMIDRFFRF